MVAKKKTSKKKHNPMRKVAPNSGFYFPDGSCCRDLVKLSDELDKMTEDLFGNFVNDEKNDFASWVKYVFQEPVLAKKLKKSKNKDRHVIEILKFSVSKLK